MIRFLTLCLFQQLLWAQADTIFLEKGNFVLAQILEVSAEQVKYKDQNIDGPIFILKQSAITKIVYAGMIDPAPLLKKDTAVNQKVFSNDLKDIRKEYSEKDILKEKIANLNSQSGTGIVIGTLGMALGGVLVAAGVKSEKDNCRNDPDPECISTTEVILIGGALGIGSLIVLAVSIGSGVQARELQEKLDSMPIEIKASPKKVAFQFRRAF